MTAQQKHIPPLLVHVTDGGAIYITDNHAFAEATFVLRVDPNTEAQARFIVTACNNHESLLEALKGMVNAFQHYTDYDPADDEVKAEDAARAAIEKAEANQ